MPMHIRLYNYQSYMCANRQLLNSFRILEITICYCESQSCWLRGSPYQYHLLTRCVICPDRAEGNLYFVYIYIYAFIFLYDGDVYHVMIHIGIIHLTTEKSSPKPGQQSRALCGTRCALAIAIVF